MGLIESKLRREMRLVFIVVVNYCAAHISCNSTDAANECTTGCGVALHDCIAYCTGKSCESKCFEKSKSCEENCPCHAKCPSGCPCDSFDCDDIYHSKFLIINNHGVDKQPALLYDPISNQFAPFKPFNSSQYEADLACSVVYRGNGYIIGGVTNSHDFVQVDDCGLKRIDYEIPSDAPLVAHSCVVYTNQTSAEDEILICGAKNVFGVDTPCYSLRMDTGNKWFFEEVAQTRSAHNSGAMTVWKGYPVVLGGIDGFEPTASVEILKITSNRARWDFLPEMPHKLQGLSAVAIEEKLFIFGGFNGRKAFSSVFVFTDSTNVWNRYSRNMVAARYGHRSILNNLHGESCIYHVGGTGLMKLEKWCFFDDGDFHIGQSLTNTKCIDYVQLLSRNICCQGQLRSLMCN